MVASSSDHNHHHSSTTTTTTSSSPCTHMASMEHALPNGPTGTVATSLVAGSLGDFYAGKTIFITGGTGFMGKVLLEKLLRACPGITRVYLLIRPKKGQNSAERLQQLLCSPLFDTIRKERPGDLGRVLPIEGDITQPELAICSADRATLARSVNIVFHSAATVKFDEKLKLSVTINVQGTQRLIELCKKMTHLEALVHVSTAYANCDRHHVEELIYPPSTVGPDHMTSLCDALDESVLDALTPHLIGRRPNTYTFTKALAESWLRDNRGELPLAIVRPSIVLSSVDGPLKGWVDNWNGPTGIIAAAGKGVFRTMLCDPNKTADLVPVDMVINLMLAAAWRVATTKSKDLPIYNCCTGLRRPISWSRFIGLCFKYMRVHPFSDVTWYPDGTVTSSALRNRINKHLMHWLPAYIIDGAVYITGGKPIMLRVQEKLSRAAECLEYFTTQQWQFEDDNVRHLSAALSEADRRQFPFDVAAIDWENYIENYVLGIRRYIFKEDLTTIPKARRQLTRLYWSHRALQLAAILTVWRLFASRFPIWRRLWSAISFALRLIMARLQLTH